MNPVCFNHIHSLYIRYKILLFRPILLGGGNIYTEMGFLFNQFQPSDITIVDSSEWYPEKARPA